MSWKDHQPTDCGSRVHCIWCHEPWPCATVKLAAEVIKDVVAEVRPTTPEPRCCDLHAAARQERQDVAEEVEDMIPEGLR